MKKNNSELINDKKNKNSSKLFVSGVLVLTVTNLIVKAIGLLFKIPMVGIIKNEGMGYYNSAYTFYTYLYMLSTAGLPTAISIMVSESRAKGQIKQVKRILKLAMLSFITVGIVATTIMFFGAAGMSNAIGASNTKYAMMAIAPTLLFICISSALRGYFQGYQQMIPTAVSEFIEAACKLGIGIALALFARNRGYGLHIQAAYAAVGLTAGAGLGMIFLLFSKLLFKEHRYDAEYIATAGVDETVTPVKSLLKKLVIIALPITLSSSVMSLTNLIDAVIVQRLLQTTGLSQVASTALYGNYTSLAVPMFNLPPVLIYPISYSIVPLLAAARKRGDTERCRIVSESSMRISMIIGIPCGLGLSTLSKPILGLFYKSGDVALAAPLLTLLGPSTAFVCILAITNALLQSAGYERKPLISMIAGALVKLVTNFILIQLIGMKGTPISTFLCYLTVTVMNLHYVHKYVGVMPKLSGLFVKPLCAAAVCSAAAYFVNMFVSGIVSEKLSVLVAILAAVVVYFIFLCLFGGITEDDLKIVPKGDRICSLLKLLKLVK